MANLVVITGPMAVGKMTVAEELKKKIGYNLMVNHDSIEVSDKIFGFATDTQKEFNWLIREAAFAITIRHNESMIFTVATDFNKKEEFERLDSLRKQFEESGGEFYFIELKASLEKRLERNVTPNRLEKKKSKQDTEWSSKNIIKGETKHRLNTRDDEVWFKNHLKINNENLEPEEVVKIILDNYDLKPEFKEISDDISSVYK